MRSEDQTQALSLSYHHSFALVFLKVPQLVLVSVCHSSPETPEGGVRFWHQKQAHLFLPLSPPREHGQWQCEQVLGAPGVWNRAMGRWKQWPGHGGFYRSRGSQSMQGGDDATQRGWGKKRQGRQNWFLTWALETLIFLGTSTKYHHCHDCPRLLFCLRCIEWAPVLSEKSFLTKKQPGSLALCLVLGMELSLFAEWVTKLIRPVH